MDNTESSGNNAGSNACNAYSNLSAMEHIINYRQHPMFRNVDIKPILYTAEEYIRLRERLNITRVKHLLRN